LFVTVWNLVDIVNLVIGNKRDALNRALV